MSAHRVAATTSDLIEFLLKRLAEDHLAADSATANLTGGGVASRIFAVPCWYAAITRAGDPVVAVDPQRAMDDITARRSLILHARAQIEHGANIGVVNAWREIVRTLAATYRSHPDYRPEWAPTHK